MTEVLYTVWYEVDASVESEWNSWMESTHVPEVVKTGGFLGAKRYRVVEGLLSKYATFYLAKDMKSLKSYLDGPAKELREEYRAKFGSKSKVTRVVLEEVPAT
jgi:hypothetical protein